MHFTNVFTSSELEDIELGPIFDQYFSQFKDSRVGFSYNALGSYHEM